MKEYYVMFNILFYFIKILEKTLETKNEFSRKFN